MAKENRLPQGENKMRTMPVGKLLFTMALPLAISMLVQAFYNIVDTYFVSQVDADASGALSLAFPIQNLQIGFATGIGVGMNSLLSKSLGENNRERANKAAGNGILLMLIAIGVFMLFGFFGTSAYYSLFNTNETARQYGIDYTTICCVFTGGIFIEILCERLLQASGRTIYTMFTQGTGAILNIILDPMFIFGFAPLGIPRMGVAGAAVATVIGQWGAAILGIIFNIFKNPDVKFGFRYLKPEKKVMRKILGVGIPSIIMMGIGSVMNFGMNQVFLRFSQTAVNVFGIYFKVQSLFLMPLIGINNASISIVAYNYGARQPKRIMTNMKYALGAAFAVMLVGVAVFQLLPDKVMGIFEATDDMVKMGVTAMRIVSIHFLLAAIGIPMSASFQALGNGIYSTLVSLCRQLVVLLPAAYLLALSGNVDMVWWSFPIAEVVSSTLCILLFIRIYKQKIKPLYQEQS